MHGGGLVEQIYPHVWSWSKRISNHMYIRMQVAMLAREKSEQCMLQPWSMKNTPTNIAFELFCSFGSSFGPSRPPSWSFQTAWSSETATFALEAFTTSSHSCNPNLLLSTSFRLFLLKNYSLYKNSSFVWFLATLPVY